MRTMILAVLLTLVSSVSASVSVFGPGGSGGGDADVIEFFFKAWKYQQWSAQHPDLSLLDAAKVKVALDRMMASLDLGDPNYHSVEDTLIQFSSVPVLLDCEAPTKEACFNRSKGSITFRRDEWRTMDDAHKYSLIAIELHGLTMENNRYSDSLATLAYWRDIDRQTIDVKSILERATLSFKLNNFDWSRGFMGNLFIEVQLNNNEDADRLIQIFSQSVSAEFPELRSWHDSDLEMLDVICNNKIPNCIARVQIPPASDTDRILKESRLIEWSLRRFGGGLKATVDMLDSVDAQPAESLYNKMQMNPTQIQIGACSVRRKEFVDSTSIFKILCQEQVCSDRKVPAHFCRFSIAGHEEEVSGFKMSLAPSPASVVTELAPKVQAEIKPMEVPKFRVYTSKTGFKFTSLIGAGWGSDAESACFKMNDFWHLPTEKEAKQIVRELGDIPAREFGTKDVHVVVASDFGGVLYQHLKGGGPHSNVIDEYAAYLCTKSSP